MIVIDASVLADALMDDGERGGAARRILDSDPFWVAPSHLIVEVISVVRRQLLRGRLSETRATEIIESLPGLVVEQVETAMVIDRLWDLRGNLTVYDAAYVASAEHMACPLVTTDGRMAKAPGIRCEVVVVG